MYMGKPFIIRWWSYLSLLTRAIKLSRKAVISNINTLCQCFQDKSAISFLHPHSTPTQRFLKSSKNLNRYKFYNELFKQPDHRVEFDTPLHSKNVLFQKIANNLNWMKFEEGSWALSTSDKWATKTTNEVNYYWPSKNMPLLCQKKHLRRTDTIAYGLYPG